MIRQMFRSGNWGKIFFTVSVLFLVAMPIVVFAQATSNNQVSGQCHITSHCQQATGQVCTTDSDCQISGDKCVSDLTKAVKMNIAIPGVTEMIADANGVKHPYVLSLACYIAGIYKYLAGIAGILAVVMMMYGGIRYVTSFGSPQSIASAKDTITSAMLGLALVLGTYVILNFINPNLTTFNLDLGTKITPIPDNIIWCENEIKGSTPQCKVACDPADEIEAPFFACPVGQIGCQSATWLKLAMQHKCGDKDIGQTTGQQCIWKGICNDAQGNLTGNICAPDYFRSGEFTCKDPENYCKAATANLGCYRIDNIIAGYQIGLTHSCALPIELNTDPTKESCRWLGILNCGDASSGWSQAVCNEGNGQDSPCWDKNGNTGKVIISTEGGTDILSRLGDLVGLGTGLNVTAYACTDKRVAAGAQAICCVKRSDIQCKSSCEPNSEIEVSYNCTAGQKGCMPMKLIH